MVSLRLYINQFPIVCDQVEANQEATGSYKLYWVASIDTRPLRHEKLEFSHIVSIQKGLVSIPKVWS